MILLLALSFYPQKTWTSGKWVETSQRASSYLGNSRYSHGTPYIIHSSWWKLTSQCSSMNYFALSQYSIYWSSNKIDWLKSRQFCPPYTANVCLILKWILSSIQWMLQYIRQLVVSCETWEKDQPELNLTLIQDHVLLLFNFGYFSPRRRTEEN